MFKLLYRAYRLISWLRYWAGRRFTRAGLALLGALVAALILGPDTDNNVSYQAFALLFGLLLVSLGFGGWFRGRFELSRTLPRVGTVGAPLTYSVAVKNLSRRPQRGLNLLDELADPRPGYAEWLAVQLAEERRVRSFRFSSRRRTHTFKRAVIQEGTVPPLAPQQAASVAVQLLPLRRGVLRLAGVTLARPDPLGLFRALRRVPLPGSVLILPKRYPLPPIALPGTLKYQEGGVALASHVGQSEEFVALRDYRQGDPLRHIHWRSWARAGKPVVKEFEDEFFVRHALVLDTFSQDVQGELLEEAVSIAASFACTVQTQESLLDLLFVGPESYCFTSGRGLGQADQMLEILASVRACSDRPFSSLEHLVLNHANVVSGCICVFLAWDEPRQRFVQKLRALGLPLLVLVLVEPGRREPIQPGPLDDPERFHVLELGKVELGLANLK